MKDVVLYPEFSVSLSVYKNDNPVHFSYALSSIINQSVKPSEIILVVDGPVSSDIDRIIEKFKLSFSNLKVLRLVENKGHAIARQTGMMATRFELVALMDSDDIAVSDRFEKQLKLFINYPELDVLGGQIIEFIDSIENITGIREVPLSDSEIKQYLKLRCPFNQQTVMLKKTSMLMAGGYIDWHYEEDYYLWIRMYECGCKFQNLSDNLVYVRVGNEMYKRRGGKEYFVSEAKLQKYLWNHNIITLPQYCFNIFIRFIVQVLLTNRIRGWIFKNFFRN